MLQIKTPSSNPAETDPSTLLFHTQDFHLDHGPDHQRLPAWHLAWVQEVVLFDAEIDECAEIDHVLYGSVQAHTILQIAIDKTSLRSIVLVTRYSETVAINEVPR